ncbi:post-GPI attachment to proteins factor 6 [Atheta coriaria]|uniref:post-GPI attachment to proteins factor 6 n=1 Tax=Dalotia coriaria TaxID=877792 RepID=UPI0031F360A5
MCFSARMTQDTKHLMWPQAKMQYLLLLLQLFDSTLVTTAKEWTQLSLSRSTYLETYKNYIDAVMMHFDIPENTINAAFKFRGRNSMSIFGCPAQDAELYLQYGAPPVINPDKSTFPQGFLLSRRESIYNISFKTDQVYTYINISSPTPGSYYAVVFFPYVNPKEQGITQDGLLPVCNSFVDAAILVQQLNITPIVSEQSITVNLQPDDAKLFKIYIPWNVYKVILVISEFACSDCDKITVQAQVFSSTASIPRQIVTIKSNTAHSFTVLGESNYFIKISSVLTESDENVTSSMDFRFNSKFIETPEHNEKDLKHLPKNWAEVADKLTKDEQNKLVESHKEMFNLNSSHLYFTTSYSPVATQYDEYVLYKTISSESFQFGYELKPIEGGYVPISINISSVGFTVLKFNIRDVLDVGGTLNVALAFRPRIRKEARWIYVDKEPQNHTVIACIHRAGIETPIWENKCQFLTRLSSSPLILNDTVTNATFMIPFPEPGNWYLSFKLFCGHCEPCNCPKECRHLIEQCLSSCEENCADDCHICQDKCEKIVVSGKAECKTCDCDGNCLKSQTRDEICNSSVLYDISSYPCVVNKCGRNGKCTFGLSEGFVYSTCVCFNNYRGWDCEDDTNANSLFMIWLELILLVFSNFAFMITVYVAYKRACYVEALTYASILIASTFYHACDAGENRINFCLVNLYVLQFCDFYCAILSIWVTLVLMAHLPPPFPHLLHVFGAIFLGAGVTMDKKSIWVFIVPVSTAALLVVFSWAIKNYRIRKGNSEYSVKIFPSKRYLMIFLPLGLLVALIALAAFALFETKSNYKYVHSFWHLMMAIAVVILLTKDQDFNTKLDNGNAAE